MTHSDGDLGDIGLDGVIAEGIRRERAGRRLTQQQLADLLGISRGSLADIERGERTVTAAICERLCVALGCSLLDLLPGERGEVARERLGIERHRAPTTSSGT